MSNVSRILMTADGVGGVWTYAMELARGLGRQEVAVTLATMGPPLTTGQRTEARQAPGLDLIESHFHLEWMDHPWQDVAMAGDWLLELEARLAPDIVHLNGYAHASLPWNAPVLVAAHSCVLSWWKAVKGEPAPPNWSRYHDEVLRGLMAADAVIAPTHAMLAALRENYSGTARNARVIPNGRSPEFYPPGVKGEFVLAAGRLWDEAKNISMLERVAPRLAWPVYIAGERKHPNGSQAAVGKIRCLGSLHPGELAEWYGHASIYALPARYEPFGLSVLEAALAGCALVLGNIPSLRENWDGAAEFVPPDDDEGLERALNRLIADSGHRTRLIARARLRARQFTPQRMADGYLETYYGISGTAGTKACA